MPNRKFVARQPILDHRGGLFGYELLFRNGLAEICECKSLDQASSSVIADSLLLLGIETLTAGRFAFVNVTRDVLLEGHVTLLPPSITVIELLESVKPDAAVLDACKRLKQAGYRIALDDFVPEPALEPLLEHADLVKIDFLSTRPDDRRRIAEALSARGIELVAEKVETQSDRDEGLRAGFRYFQGYYFAHPEIVVARDVPGWTICVEILHATAKEHPDFDELARLVGRSPSLSYKLLRAANSALFGLCDTVRSIQHALALLGFREVRKWISLLTMASLGARKPCILVSSTLERARFCELLAPVFGMPERSAELFLLGLFSRMDAILDRPLEALLCEVSLEPDVRAALLQRAGPLAPPYEAVLAFERGSWRGLAEVAGDPDREVAIAEAWREALAWSAEALSLALHA